MRKRENSLKEENNSFQNDKTKERLKKSENKDSMSKVKERADLLRTNLIIMQKFLNLQLQKQIE